MNKLIAVCAWCGKLLRWCRAEQTHDDELVVTHGICDPCQQKVLADAHIESKPKTEPNNKEEA